MVQPAVPPALTLSAARRRRLSALAAAPSVSGARDLRHGELCRGGGLRQRWCAGPLLPGSPAESVLPATFRWEEHRPGPALAWTLSVCWQRLHALPAGRHSVLVWRWLRSLAAAGKERGRPKSVSWLAAELRCRPWIAVEVRGRGRLPWTRPVRALGRTTGVGGAAGVQQRQLDGSRDGTEQPPVLPGAAPCARTVQ